jgi:hypothetical protein
MATTAIHDCCEAGALGGLLAGRGNVALTAAAASNVTLVAVAKAIADEFITVNTASGAALADADKVNMPQIVQSVAHGICDGRAPLVTAGVADLTAADYVTLATQIYAVAVQAKTNGGLT